MNRSYITIRTIWRSLVLLLLLVFSNSPQALAKTLLVVAEHPFEENVTNTMIRLEASGSQLIDVRLYRIHDPEKFFLAQPDWNHIQIPQRISGERENLSPESQRIPGLFALMGQALTDSALEVRRSLSKGLSPAARDLARVTVQGPSSFYARPLPFLSQFELEDRWDLTCGESPEEYSYCDLDIGPRAAGAYLVEAVAGHQTAHAVALFTRLSLVARRDQDTLSLLAIDGRSGISIPGVHISVLPGERSVIRGTSGRKGLLTTKIPSQPSRVLGQIGPHVALLSLPNVPTMKPELQVLLFTDRGEYAPSDQVVFHGFARTEENRPLAPPRAEEIKIFAYDSGNNLFHVAECPLSAQGGFGGNFHLPPSLPPGLYRLVAQIENKAANAEFTIRSPSFPHFTISGSLKVTRAGIPARVALKTLFANRPLSPAQVTWHAVRLPVDNNDPGAPQEMERGELSVDGNGYATFSFPTSAGMDARYEVSLWAQDRQGHTAAVTLSEFLEQSSLRITLKPEIRIVAPGQKTQLQVKSQDIHGRPVSAKITLRALAARTGTGNKEYSAEETIQTNIDGQATYQFQPSTTGYYEIDASRSGISLAETFLYVTQKGGDIPFTSDTLTLVPDKESYNIGETARILVLAPFDSASALFSVESQDFSRQEVVEIKGFSALYSIKVTPSLAPNFIIAAQSVFQNQTWHSQQVLPVEPRSGRLNIQAALEYQLAPGESQLKIQISSKDKPVNGEIFAIVRDARSIPSPAPSLLDFFYPKHSWRGVTGNSNDYRSSNIGGFSSPTAFVEDVEEDSSSEKENYFSNETKYLHSGTLLAKNVFTNGKGQASVPLSLPTDVDRVHISLKVVAGNSMGEWNQSIHQNVSLVAGKHFDGGDTTRRKIGASLEQKTIPFSGLKNAVLQARMTMGNKFEPMTSRAIARLLAGIARWRALKEKSLEERSAVLTDIAALAGLADPQGSWSIYQGGPKDPCQTSWALIALALAKVEGLEVDSLILSQGLSHIRENKCSNTHSSLITALLSSTVRDLGPSTELNPANNLLGLLNADRKNGLSLEERALLVWTFKASGKRAWVKEVSQRLEQSIRSNRPLLNTKTSNYTVQEYLRFIALAVYVSHDNFPASYSTEILWLLQNRGKGHFGQEIGGGFAVLALEAIAARKPAILFPKRWNELLSKPEDTSQQENIFTIQRTFQVLDNNRVPINRAIAVGDRVAVSIRVHSQRSTGALRLEDSFPGGLEPVEQEEGNELVKNGRKNEHARLFFIDDHAVFFLPGLSRGETIFNWEALAKNSGTFQVPPVRLSADSWIGSSGSTSLRISE